MEYSELKIPAQWAQLMQKHTPWAEKGVLDITKALDHESGAGKTIYPPAEDVFRAFELTPPDQVKVVIIGQDPYHGPGQANGLAFSVAPDQKTPPSLLNIFAELVKDTGCHLPPNGDLTPWAQQGVLLLNTSLSVEAGKPGSHSKLGWQAVVQPALRALLLDRQEKGLPYPVFVLWGAHAQTFMEDEVLEGQPNMNIPIVWSTHPSPFSARRAVKGSPAFMGSRPFSKVNEYLKKAGIEPITWALG